MLNGKIYKIYYINDPTIYYIGSTFKKIETRLRNHIYAYNEWIEKIRKFKCAIYPYFKKYGIENFKIELIKEYKVIEKQQLLVYETLYIRKLSPVNIKQPFALSIRYKHKQKYKKNKITTQLYYQKNKEKLKKQKHEYYIKNKEKIKEYNKLNKEKFQEYNKEYRLKNKEYYKEYRLKNKEYYKEYRLKNKEIYKEKAKEYYQNNKENKKEYYNKNKEIYKEKAKEYYEINKEKVKEKYKNDKKENKDNYKCECCNYSTHIKSNLNIHFKSIKHNKNIISNLSKDKKEIEKDI
jgi:hypothetical protein